MVEGGSGSVMIAKENSRTCISTLGRLWKGTLGAFPATGHEGEERRMKELCE